MAYPSWGRGQEDFPQTILETSEKAQSPERHAPVRVRLPFAFLAFLGSSGWCQVVFRPGPEFPGQPALDAEIGLWAPRKWGHLNLGQTL